MSSESPVALGGSRQDFTPPVHIYEPHRAGIPNLGPYIRELWRRREFASESSKAALRSENTLTVFGQVWMVLNPLLLAGVYYLLVSVLSGKPQGWGYFSHLTGGLFAFYFVSNSMMSGAQSIVGGGKLLLNTSFPRLLMPFAAVRTAFFRFLPTVPVYLLFHVLAGNPWNLGTLSALAFLFLLVIFSLGIAAFFATIQVYFRDATSFLPYLNRIWLYVSPVLITIDKMPKELRSLGEINPLFSLLGGYTEALVSGTVPSLRLWLFASGWSVAALVIGSLFFISRERDFAVRIF
ncbi:ABC transporter permease [Intrasporangium chromatireducens Q5-1]|uniref:Transport permease protein n=1 Tax=Intrasporangium chromatireducens Q5-1 TaxID=584657 RepID=W9GR83_9MICO|nr:ABC transporter permease [Intrasporangium chromatireducens]EWT07542.1 ABC transporter permease [Intrasporangium chromatireducens Q5-1]